MHRPRLLAWFRDGPLPSIVTGPSIVVGGTGLLREFLALAARIAEPCDLAVAAPFIGAGIARELRSWQALPHELLSVRETRRDGLVAARELGPFKWRSLAINLHRRLHAKLYSVIRPSGGGVCLVGSHNLTTGGARTNEEAGVLFIGSRDPKLGEVIRACHDRIIHLSSRGTVLADSLRWPNNEAA